MTLDEYNSKTMLVHIGMLSFCSLNNNFVKQEKEMGYIGTKRLNLVSFIEQSYFNMIFTYGHTSYLLHCKELVLITHIT